MEFDDAAKKLAELGHPVRLKVFRLLVQAGLEGLPVKAIQAHVGIPNSTLSHHLAHLVSAGLITQTREGRILRCRASYPEIKQVLDFLLQDCCAGVVQIQG
ncbi:MAG: metalloregulator ArsR/SmtB family transcription factor [Desulfarculaceae bacterium]|nr:metalloregulator ArsR/SmtB family transcription factor [Desulfarculaceae bacterium]MCF8071582.1 metalloregulator ArsR/SmtB family transcription factor [Desulfarculaceae bacterium]MCF8102397.1 metalloregulator ArsR/SmtB family transcription factor [Desulfarculaceae bacterium]MCF8114861.1 metalloregulator ArsR/SmtB family transcription factor [Desulfarculaceae bacterium]